MVLFVPKKLEYIMIAQASQAIDEFARAAAGVIGIDPVITRRFAETAVDGVSEANAAGIWHMSVTVERPNAYQVGTDQIVFFDKLAKLVDGINGSEFLLGCLRLLLRMEVENFYGFPEKFSVELTRGSGPGSERRLLKIYW